MAIIICTSTKCAAHIQPPSTIYGPCSRNRMCVYLRAYMCIAGRKIIDWMNHFFLYPIEESNWQFSSIQCVYRLLSLCRFPFIHSEIALDHDFITKMHTMQQFSRKISRKNWRKNKSVFFFGPQWNRKLSICHLNVNWNGFFKNYYQITFKVCWWIVQIQISRKVKKKNWWSENYIESKIVNSEGENNNNKLIISVFG